ncbi:autotransporter-associated beta strand repeat-containing protein, partial [Variovorax paradoxus]|nr:autotransporter-associated beta strand repeat-containing protein [Variovorax paradoxus]
MNHAYRVLWNRAKQAWVVASELAPSVGKASCKSARNPLRRAGVKSSRRSITAAACMGVFGSLLSVAAAAATYTAADETQLRQAIQSANSDGDPSASITLTGNIALSSTTAFPAFIKPVTINTGSFTLSGLDTETATATGGSLSFVAGSQLTTSGTFRGGNANQIPIGGVRQPGGAGITLSTGSLTNLGSISGGIGGVTFRNNAGAGGAGANLTGSTLLNQGSLTGGNGGGADAGGVIGFSSGRSAGVGGAGLVMAGGSLNNQTQITGGNGGSWVRFPGNADNYFGGPGGPGAQLDGGTHANTGTITGGNGGVGRNDVGSTSGSGPGGSGLVLTGGATFVNNGTLRGGLGTAEAFGADNKGAPGGSGATVTGSTLTNNSTITGGTGAMNAPGGVGVSVTNGTVTNTGAIRGGTGGVFGPGNAGIVGSGGANVVTSGEISGGRSGNAAATQNAAVVFTGGNNRLELRAGFVNNGNVIGTATDSLVLGGNTNSSFSAAAIGPAVQYRGFGSYQKVGSSTWTLTGTTAATTPWQILGGTLSVAQDASLGATAGALTINGGILQVTGTGFTSTARAINWGAAGGGFDIADPTNTFTVSQSLTGGGPLQKLGAGTLVFTGTNTYTGGTTISAGTLQIGNGGTTGSIAGDVLNNGTLAFNRSDNLSYGGQISGTGALRQQGSGTTILTGANSYTGGTTIAAGTLQLGNGGTSGSIVGDVVNNGTLVLDRSDTLTLAGLISGTGTLTQQGTGTTVLTGANSYSGATDVV